MIYEIVLDLDDVCNTFCTAALGIQDYGVYPPACGWDIVQAANRIHGTDMARWEFWDSLDRDFWANIPPVPYLSELLTYLARRVGNDNITIATSPTLSPECVAGKLEWIHRRLPLWIHRQYMIGTRKDRLANPHALLIDDRRGNCDKFVARGGQALLVHQPWNHTDSGGWNHITLLSLQAGLYKYFGERFEY